MGRPKLPRKACCKPICKCFKPRHPLKEGVVGVSLGADEFTALKLHDVDELDQKKAAKKMKISQPTFARILASAHQKLSLAIIKGKEIRIN
jgi:predicted DNA-binding protein (UPF0251 family)